jgi:hypothetical protein
MKTMKKSILLVILLIAFLGTTFGQATVTATSTATIVTPIAMTNTNNLAFGDIAVDATGGDVTISAAAVPVRTTTAPTHITLITTGTHPISSADFAVTGLTGSTYAITLPANGVVTLTGAGAPMPVGTFTSSVGATGSLATGAETFYVGATLTVGGSQVAGNYTGTFQVSVNYN